MKTLAAEPGDARAVAEIQVRTWRAAYRGIVPDDYLASMQIERLEARWAESIGKGEPHVLVAKDAGRALGWVSFGRSRDAGATPTDAEIWAFYVEASQWGKGVGRSLWLHAQALLAVAGFRHVCLWAFPENTRAAGFYRKMGFTADAASARTFTLGGHTMREIRFARGLTRPRPAVRRLESSEWQLYRSLRLQALADSPDAFGSTFAAESALLDKDWADRLARGAQSTTDLPLIAEVDGIAAGLAWARIAADAPERVNLYQMWVAPAYRSLGTGRVLLSTAIGWAREKKARVVELGVTCGDTPATRLYSRAGFRPVGVPAPLRPGSPLFGQTMHLALVEGRT